MGTSHYCPFSHTLGQEWQGTLPAKGGRYGGAWLGRETWLGRGVWCGPPTGRATYSGITAFTTTIGQPAIPAVFRVGLRMGLCRMTIILCDCLNITEEKEKPSPARAGHMPRDTEWAGGEGSLLSAFRTDFFCHLRCSPRFDLSAWTLENVPRVPLGRENLSGEPGRGQA